MRVCGSPGRWPVKPDHFARVRALFEEAVAIPEAAREAHLQALEVDAATLAEVRGLLRLHAQSSTTSFVASLFDAMVTAVGPALQAGDTVGVWRIDRVIGAGGMGLVYLVARNDGHFTQKAALKFLRGLPSAERLAYFAHERQLLATLAHPNIARLLDGGSTERGEPYLVMEYVDGLPIDAYCRAHRLGRDAMLTLFVDACAAVAFAHRQRIVHCDIKPSNLLVNADGRPMLLDFGVARWLARRATDDVTPAAATSPAFTPRYSSPEQRDQQEVSTASDIYSLGILLRELLLEVVADDAKTPRVLSAIVAKATQTAANSRYSSVDAMIADIQAFSAQRPVAALNGGRWYEFRCFVLRNKLSVALVGVLLLAVLGSLIAISLSLVNAQRERVRAERIAQFLGNVLGAVDPDHARDLDKTLLREILDTAAISARDELADDPLLQADIERIIGNTYAPLGESEKAIDHFTASLALLPASRLRERLVLRERIADMKDWLSRPMEALQEYEAILSERLRAFGPFDADTLQSRSALADQFTRAGDYRRGLAETLALQPDIEKVLGRDHPLALANRYATAMARSDLGLMQEAEADYRRTLADFTRLYGKNHSKAFNVAMDLAVLYLRNQRYAEAEALLRSLQPRAIKYTGETSFQSIRIASMLGSALRYGGKLQESGPYYAFALDQSLKRYGQDHSATLQYEVNYANFEAASGHPAEALLRYVRIEPLVRKAHGAQSPVIAELHRGRAKALTLLDRRDEARQAWEAALAIDRGVYTDDEHPEIQEALEALEALR